MGLGNVFVAHLLLTWHALRLLLWHPRECYSVRFSDAFTKDSEWCSYTDLGAAQEAADALNWAYKGSKQFWVPVPEINGQIITLAPPKPVETPKPALKEDPAWLVRLKEDERRRFNPNPYNRPWAEGYRARGWPYDD